MKRKSPTISPEVAEQRRQQCIERNTTYTATVTYPGRKRKSKDFSVDKYGKEQALQFALSWRESQLVYLETLGVIYAESHGTNG